MPCSMCGSENPAGNNFCARCGNALARPCLKCGAENAPPSNFCGKWGAALTAPVCDPVSETPPMQSREVAGERRHLTVLFCDLVGSTAIASRLDPEQWRETIAGYHRAAAEAIVRFDGHVAKYLGDGPPVVCRGARPRSPRLVAGARGPDPDVCQSAAAIIERLVGG